MQCCGAWPSRRRAAARASAATARVRQLRHRLTARGRSGRWPCGAPAARSRAPDQHRICGSGAGQQTEAECSCRQPRCSCTCVSMLQHSNETVGTGRRKAIVSASSCPPSLEQVDLPPFPVGLSFGPPLQLRPPPLGGGLLAAVGLLHVQAPQHLRSRGAAAQAGGGVSGGGRAKLNRLSAELAALLSWLTSMRPPSCSPMEAGTSRSASGTSSAPTPGPEEEGWLAQGRAAAVLGSLMSIGWQLRTPQNPISTRRSPPPAQRHSGRGNSAACLSCPASCQQWATLQLAAC